MKSFFHKIADLQCGWNEMPLGEDAFQRLCYEYKINVKRLPLSVNGFYTCANGKHYIAVNQRLSDLQATFVMFHEFGHFLMHMPSTDAIENYCGVGVQSRDEKEADAFAYCALLPLELFKTRDVAEIADMYGGGFLMRRLEVYDRYGI